MAVKTVKRKRTIISPDSVDIDALSVSITSQGNAIPAGIAVVLRLAAPILARIAIRYVARRLKRNVSEQTVRAGGKYVSDVAGRIIDRYGTG